MGHCIFHLCMLYCWDNRGLWCTLVYNSVDCPCNFVNRNKKENLRYHGTPNLGHKGMVHKGFQLKLVMVLKRIFFMFFFFDLVIKISYPLLGIREFST